MIVMGPLTWILFPSIRIWTYLNKLWLAPVILEGFHRYRYDTPVTPCWIGQRASPNGALDRLFNNAEWMFSTGSWTIFHFRWFLFNPKHRHIYYHRLISSEYV